LSVCTEINLGGSLRNMFVLYRFPSAVCTDDEGKGFVELYDVPVLWAEASDALNE
jgi:hypothetical protein